MSACVAAACPHMIAAPTECASFVSTWDGEHKRLELVAIYPHELWSIQSANRKHTDDTFNSYEGIGLKQSSNSKLQLLDLDLRFYQISP